MKLMRLFSMVSLVVLLLCISAISNGELNKYNISMSFPKDLSRPSLVIVDNDGKPPEADLPDRSSCIAGQTADKSSRGIVTIEYQDFEGTFPTPGWRAEVFYAGDADCTWDDVDCKAYEGNKSAWCADIGTDAPATDCSSYLNYMSAALIYGPFDLSDAIDAAMELRGWLQCEVTYDVLCIMASIDDVDYYGECFDGDTGGWYPASSQPPYYFDLTDVYSIGNLCGQPQVWIMFLFFSDEIYVVGEGAYVDNVHIWKQTQQCTAVPVATWTFEPPPEGWSYRTAAPPPDIPAWSHASSIEVTGPGAIGLNSPVDETTDYYGSWDNYSGNPEVPAISWVDNSAWRAIFTMTTDKADANTVPSIRLRLALNHMKATSYIQVLPGSWLPLAQRGVDTTDYKLYLRPPIVDNGFFLALDLIDFGQPFAVPCDGTVYLEEVVVERFDLNEPCFDDYWTAVTTYANSGLHTWTHSSAGVSYLTDVNGYSQPTDGLDQNTTPTQTRAFGAWTSPSDEVDLISNQFYRAVWTLASEDSSLGGAERIRLHTDDFRYSSYMVIDRDANPANSALPPATGKDYYLYAEFPGAVAAEKLLLAWDLFDFDPGAGGWAKLTNVAVSRRDLP